MATTSIILLPTMKIKAFALAALMCALAGCGGSVKQAKIPTPSPTPTPTITAAQVFSNKAETWTFENGYGDTTTIEILPQNDGSSVWHYLKNADRAYWQPGIASELFFRIELDHNQWYSPDFRVLFPQGCPYSWCGTPPIDMTFVNTTDPGKPRPYLIIADSGTTLDTSFNDFGTPNTRWKTLGYVENVTTLFYSGPALVSEQWEGLCTHEKWYFAPGLGLIEVIPFDGGDCKGLDPLLTMERVN